MTHPPLRNQSLGMAATVSNNIMNPAVKSAVDSIPQRLVIVRTLIAANALVPTVTMIMMSEKREN